MYDAIIVGARCAGSPTAMLLARRGFKVLLLDRATFPSDTISTHILWPHGAEVLARWGLLDRLAAPAFRPSAAGCDSMSDRSRCTARFPTPTTAGAASVRVVTVLDRLLLNAAAEAGVEVREGFSVDELLMTDDVVVGVRGRGRGERPIEERARVVIGADGVNSFVARTVRAPEYDLRPVAACGYYSYFSGVTQDDIELYVRDHCAFGGAPTNDGLHLVMVNWPASDFPARACGRRRTRLAGARGLARFRRTRARRPSRREMVRHSGRSGIFP